MVTIYVTGTAQTDYPDLENLVAEMTHCDEDFSDYFYDNYTFKDAVTGGRMTFSVVNDQLMTSTVYSSSRELTDEELEVLRDYTRGQWSDGIGEGFEQEPCMYDDNGYLRFDEDSDVPITYTEHEVYVSPWHPEQETQIVQVIN